MQKMQQQQQFVQQQHQMEMERMAFDRETKVMIAKIDASSFVASAQVNSNAKIDTQQLKDLAAEQHLIVKNEGQIQVEKTKGDLENQKPL